MSNSRKIVISAAVAAILLCLAGGIGLYMMYSNEAQQNKELKEQLAILSKQEKKSAIMQRVNAQMEEIANEERRISDEQREAAVEQTKLAEQERQNAEQQQRKAEQERQRLRKWHSTNVPLPSSNAQRLSTPSALRTP